MKQKFIVVAGPCLAESEYLVLETASYLKKLFSNFSNIDFYFKASYKKANRTSYDSFSGVGDELALSWLNKVRTEFSLNVLTDVHTPDEAILAAKYVDILQIPAFLARQTELLTAAASTNKIINIKKGQFMAPDDMKKAADKIIQSNGFYKGNNIWLTERGTFFGYHDLVVDFRSMLIMKEYGHPVIYDATHSLQLPSIGEQSGGMPQFIFPMAKAAVVLGVNGIFFETHPNPQKALSDSQTQILLTDVDKFIYEIMNLLENQN
jgi:2-dehydro-3-deoxyphosphooctonate aldolase (KDO 8-P synthase)